MAHQEAQQARTIIAKYFATDAREDDTRSFRQLHSNRHDLGNLLTLVHIEMGALLDESLFPEGEQTTVNAFVAEVERAFELQVAA